MIGAVPFDDLELEELCDVDEDAQEDDRDDVRQDPRPLGRVGHGVVVLDRFGYGKVPKSIIN